MSPLASATLVTPFGVPFDTAVVAGIVLTILSVALAGRRSRRTADDGGEQ
ncbi:hypothetical protein [Prauserella alba]|uniref:PEP-CTERM protein-sorting domain-containing protein n=1 Tax=Prauserella alba TaxID=176898 RepID=A0ABN1V9S0_9PSEU|nr:hypothetical protein [Prauserella alba]MCP2181208.1 hypothetical protein [Prauserella alba]